LWRPTKSTSPLTGIIPVDPDPPPGTPTGFDIGFFRAWRAKIQTTLSKKEKNETHMIFEKKKGKK
jgi:hypothetical protein